MRTLILAALLAVGLNGGPGAAPARAGCCAHCGCRDGCTSVCRLERTEKKIETICWGMKCEDFCVPGCSECASKNCDIVCEECEPVDCDEPSGAPRRIVWREWIPGCARIFTKRKLYKRTVVTKVPSYKWVVEDMCEQCQQKHPSAVAEPGAKIPPPPVAALPGR